MKIHLPKAHALELSAFDAEGFDISGANPALEFTALAMFVASLARCTFSVLAVYGERFDADPDTITMALSWEFDGPPSRFSKIEMNIHWPSLPEKRLKAGQRVAHHCTIHNTIHDCVEVETRVSN